MYLFVIIYLCKKQNKLWYTQSLKIGIFMNGNIYRGGWAEVNKKGSIPWREHSPSLPK